VVLRVDESDREPGEKRANLGDDVRPKPRKLAAATHLSHEVNACKLNSGLERSRPLRRCRQVPWPRLRQVPPDNARTARIQQQRRKLEPAAVTRASRPGMQNPAQRQRKRPQPRLPARPHRQRRQHLQRRQHPQQHRPPHKSPLQRRRAHPRALRRQRRERRLLVEVRAWSG